VTLLLRMLARDWRAGEVAVLFAALLLAVTMVSGISGFAATLNATLRQESNAFLAADLVVADSRELPADWFAEADRRAVASASLLSFSSMVFAGEDMVLASVKAASDAYPLRGELQLSDTPYGEQRAHRGAPARGSVWLDPRLFTLLDVGVGDRVDLGAASFTVAAALRGEPDRGGSFLGAGPRVMLNLADIPATQIVQPGSRVRYRALFAAEEERLGVFRSWLEEQLGDGQRIRDVNNDQPRVGEALERAERFLLLGGSLAVILAGVAIAMAARRFSERHQRPVALLKSLGAPRRQVQRLYAGNLLIIGLAATLTGWCLAGALQWLALLALEDMLGAAPSFLQPRPYLIGAVTALVCLSCFAWPPLNRLSAVSPLLVLRSDMPLHSNREHWDYLLGLLAVSALMWWYSADLQLTLVVLGGLAVLVASGTLLAWLLLRGGRGLGMQAGSVWRLALAGLQRHGLANALQVVVFSVTVMLLLLLAMLRGSLLADWQAQLPAEAPNHFLLNIGPEELESVSELLDASDLESERLYPMLRGRLMAVAGDALPVTAEDEEGPRQREANFTWAAAVPEGNELVAGRWWSADGAAEVSLEQDFAERLGIGLGDRLDLLIGAQPLSVTVSSLRTLDWESFKPNFFLVFPPGLLDQYPATWMTSFYLPPQRKAFLNTLLRAHPTVTVIEVDAIMAQLRDTLGRVSAAIEVVLLLVLLAGLLVLVAGVQSSMDLRLRESALLRALGAGRRRVLGGIGIEFTVLGTMAGVLAVLAAEGAFWALQRFVFRLDYLPSPELWLPGVLGAATLIAALGLWSCRRVVRVAPAAVLREL
jgi:putative ABC transport system permease protein